MHAESAGGPLAAEVGVSREGPLGGVFAVALAYDRGGFLSAGGGMGFGDFTGHAPPMGVFGRVRLLRLGPLALGMDLSLSRERHEVEEVSAIPGTAYQRALAHWTWAPAYRVDLQIFAEVLAGNWSLRLESGVGRRLNQPACTFYGERPDLSSDTFACSQAPSAYQWDQAPDRNVRPTSFVLEHRFDLSQSSPAGPAPPEYRSPVTAYRLSLYATLLPLLAGSALIATGVNYDSGGVIVLGSVPLVLGLTFGPSVGYLYAGEDRRGWGHGLLRLAGVGLLAAGSLAYLPQLRCEYCTGSPATTALLVLGFATALGAMASSIYDIARAPQAAQRENERHGISALSVVPMVAPDHRQAPKGLGLMGRF